MTANASSAGDRNALLESFAAELARTAYPVLLRYGLEDAGDDLELALGRALVKTISNWGQEWPQGGSPDAFAVWREGFLVDLAEEAFHVALLHGLRGAFLEVELALHQAFGAAIGDLGREPAAS